MDFSIEKKYVFKKIAAIAFFQIFCFWSVVGQQCPPNISVSNDPGRCGAQINVPRPCETATNHSGFYTVGVHEVISVCGETRCTTRITVTDGEGPIFPTCANRSIQLLDGQCGPNAFELLNPIDNCDAFGALRISPINGNLYPITHEFKPGTYNLAYRVTDRVNNSSTCSFTLTVAGITNRTTAMACTKNLNLSLDSTCMAIVTPKILLEGGPYGCLEDYTIQVFDELNRPISDTLRSQHVNKKIKAEVTSPEGNKCWTNITLEDKEPPVLNCKPIYTVCESSVTPGALLPSSVPFKAHLTNSNKFISSVTSSSRAIPISVFGLENGSISNVRIALRIKHTNVSNLTATIQSPNGTVRNLFTSLGTCTRDDINIVLDDNFLRPNSALVDSCAMEGPAKKGNFKPQQTLAPLALLNPNGIWTVTINDNVSGDGGVIDAAIITFTQNGNILMLPTDKEVTFTNQGNNTLLVNGLDNCLPSTLKYSDSIADQDCDQLYASIIYRKWEAVDALGNKSTPCTQLIHIYRPDLSTVITPPNYDDNEAPSLNCADWQNSVPSPDVTGRPSGANCKNIQIFPHEDSRFAACGNSYKILRRWKISDWCTGEVITHDQIIKIADKDGPELICPNDTTISASSHTCNTNLKPKRPRIIKECSNVLRYELSFFTPLDEDLEPSSGDFTRIGVVGDSIINNLPIGLTYIRWIVRDECFNETTCIYSIRVRDEIAPVAICRQFTTVSIGAQGGAWINALNLDDKSYDNCGIVKWEARKMTNICDTINPDFAEKIFFCCIEVGSRVMVNFRITDASGNSNLCMVEVRVEDKLPPYIFCPSNRTIDCTQDFRDSLVSGVPEYGDNCGIDGKPTVKDSVKIDDCGRGIVLRTWTVKDVNGYVSSCTQRITVVNNNRFTRDSIRWPKDLDTTSCMINLHPDSIPSRFGRPIVKSANCGLVAVNYKDQVFRFSPGACEKTLRTWTVIDWCNYNDNDKRGVYEYTQVLKLSNKTAPTFDVCKNDTVLIYDKCEGVVSQSKTAMDDCTAPNLIRYNWSIDVLNDGIAPDTMKGLGTNFNRLLPVGTHLVKWTADDLCGNSTTCKYLLTVKDGKKPTPYCLSSISTVVMPSNGMIAIWAKDFDYGSFDNCTPTNKLKISFSSDIKDTSRTFRCIDIPNGKSQLIPLKMWVTDEAGNQEYCDVSIVIQDNTGNVCPDVNVTARTISGNVSYKDGTPVKDAEIKIESKDKTEANLMTNASGNFVVNGLIANGMLSVSAQKDDDPIKGINTLDLVFIQRHILGTDRFKNPDQYLAADVNKDGRISVGDIVDLRRLILGIDINLPNGSKPFRIVEKNSLSGNNSSNLIFNEIAEINTSGTNFPNTNFTAIRIGDLDNSSLKELNGRNNGEKLLLDYHIIGNKIIISAAESKEITGLQMQLNTILDNISYIEKGKFTIENKNYSFLENSNKINLSYHEDDVIRLSKGDHLFTIILKENIGTNIPLSLSKTAYNQWYDAYDNIKELELISRTKSESQSFQVHQNVPNPFNQYTDIEVELNKQFNDPLNLNIYDLTGKKVYSKNFDVTTGSNKIRVSSDQLTTKGLYQYEVIYGTHRFIGRMLFVD